MRYFASADIGTQGTKAAVVDRNGEIVSTAFRPSRLIRGSGGSVEQDPDDILLATTEAIAEAVARSGVPAERIVSLGMDGQMAGILGIDRHWRPVMPYDSWLDTRCASVMPDLKAWGEERIISITGCPVTYAHGPKMLWWKRERPEIYRQIAKFLVPAAFVAGKLAGLTADRAFIDYTYLHFTGFADTREGRWSPDLIRAFGMDEGKLPAIVRPWDIIGRIQPEYAQSTGLAPGTPIVAGCGDTAACALGAGLTQPGNLLDVAGTASVLACCVADFCPDTADKTLLYARSVLPDLYTPLAYISGGGECMTWFRRLIGGRFPEGLSYDELNREASRIGPGSDGLLFIPHFGGRVCPNDTRLRGGWIGLHWGHGEAAMYRSILESVAYEYAGYLGILEKLTGPIAYSQVHAVGGGASSPLFNRIKADVLGIPYRPLRNRDTALTAGALIAGYAAGEVSDLGRSAAVQAEASMGEEIKPEERGRERYAGFVESYGKAVSGLSALYRSL